jgi:hypothetical protein
MAAWISLISALAGILVGGVVTYATSRSQLRIEAKDAYDRALRDMRIPHYQQLFHRTYSEVAWLEQFGGGVRGAGHVVRGA